MSENKPKILLVDDIYNNLVALDALVSSDDIEVYQADSGEAALALLLEHDFALAMLDVQMPVMNGFGLAELMRGLAQSRHIPIIFVTAGVREKQYQFKGYESGAVDFLYKPLDEYMVRSKVRIFVDLYRQRNQLARQNAELQQARREQDALVEKLLETQRRLEQAMRVREEFLSMAALELRTPLTSMQLQVQSRLRNLKRSDGPGANPANLQGMLESTAQELEPLILLVDDMLDVSRASLGRLPLHPERVDLAEIVRGIADSMAHRFEMLGAVIKVDCGKSVIGWWDRHRIKQILANLLGNVLLHSPGSSAEVLVSEKGESAIIEVADEGLGIPEDSRERIFGKFETVRPEDGAAGVGLYISRQIAELHGGSISVENRAGKGAVFIVELPLRQQPIAARNGEEVAQH